MEGKKEGKEGGGIKDRREKGREGGNKEEEKEIDE